MRRRRVKITGIGPVTPAGIGREEFWNGILEPVSRIKPFSKFGDEFGPFVAAQVPPFDAPRILGRRVDLPKGTARHTMFAVVGALLALQDAGITLSELQRAKTAVVTGSSLLDFGGIGTAIDAVSKKGQRAAQARVVYTTTLTSVLEAISEACAITCRTMAVQTSCCSGLDAIGKAADLVASGEVDIALCGGTECPLFRFPLLELRAAGLTPVTTELADRISRPFDLWRTTGVVSEGACMFALEPETSSRPGYAEVSGYGFANDPPGMLCGGLIDSTRLALAGAGLRPSDIDVLNAWGPGHRAIDAGEVSAMRAVFGNLLSEISAVSVKGAIGAALGAAPAIQIGVAALGIATGLIPPTVNWSHPDPDCPLNLSSSVRAVMHRTTLVNAHGVGNINSSMILQRC